ncbi:MAG: hypothetical protein ACO3YY_08165 [Phycisphaerales bacterium]
MPDIGQIGPICSDSNDHPHPRTSMSSPRIAVDDDGPLRDSHPREETQELRDRRIEGIRQAIKAGTYPSDDKLELAMKRMFDELAS